MVARSTGRPADVPGKLVAALDRIARGVRTHRQSVATRVGVTPLQAELVRTIADGNPPLALTGPLATELGVSQPTVSDSLTALERKGFVERTPIAEDRRRTTIGLTAEGLQLARELDRADESLRLEVARLTDDDQDQGLRLLLDLISGLLDSGVLAVARTCPSCRYFESSAEGDRCALLEVALAPAELRVNCSEHQPA